MTDTKLHGALTAMSKATYWGSTRRTRMHWVLFMAGLDYAESVQFIRECVAAKVLEEHRFGTWLSMTEAGRDLERNFKEVTV